VVKEPRGIPWSNPKTDRLAKAGSDQLFPTDLRKWDPDPICPFAEPFIHERHITTLTRNPDNVVMCVAWLYDLEQSPTVTDGTVNDEFVRRAPSVLTGAAGLLNHPVQ
jgi:hypothetical protein